MYVCMHRRMYACMYERMDTYNAYKALSDKHRALQSRNNYKSGKTDRFSIRILMLTWFVMH